MESYLGYMQTAISKLPVACLTDELLHQMDQKGLLENPSLENLFSLNVESLTTQISLISRIVALYFVYPKLAPVSSLYNAGMGIVHLLIGGVQRFKTKDAEDSAAWGQVAFNIHKGCAHLIIAGYDFGIGFSARNKYLIVGSMALFAAQPLILKQFHQKFFKKPEEGQSMPGEVKACLADDCVVFELVRNITTKFLPKSIIPSDVVSKDLPVGEPAP